MKTSLKLFIASLIMSFLLIGCSKDNPVSNNTNNTPSVDFTMSYQIIGDTTWFMECPTQTVYIDKLRYQYQAYDETLNLDPNTVYTPTQTYYIFWISNIIHPADCKFTFTGRRVSDNSSYEVQKTVHVPQP